MSQGQNDLDFEHRIWRMQADGFNVPVRTSELVKAWERTVPVSTSSTLERAIAATIQLKRAEQIIDMARGLLERASAPGVLSPRLGPEVQDANDTPADLFDGALRNLDHAIKEHDAK